ncbi:ParB/RepB/Spo0J family partition protein [Zavarzinella formosa]|uniref:ParB/RepB/Spo0J family partition protein n=1 Tax=Zavarzinella formosa TaxID=360055 RepID=UPI0002FAC78C|nr:ParB/RepB/Spo0J family partition protein [Zavarzinella formosa]
MTEPEFMAVMVYLCFALETDGRDRTTREYAEYRDNVLRPDIRRRGIQVPLLGYKSGTKTVIYDGVTRLECARLENLETVPVLVYPEPPSEKEKRKGMWLSNEMRRDFTPRERAKFYFDTLRAENWTQAQLCFEYGIKAPRVSKALKWLENLIVELHAKVGEGDGMIPERAAYTLADLSSDAQRETAKRIVAGLLTVEALEAEVAREKARSAKAKPKPKKLKDGPLSLVFPGDWATEKIVEALTAIIRKVRRGGEAA